VRLLLDSHTLLWSLENSPHLSSRAAQAIRSRGNQVFFSYASLWEISIKVALGKLTVQTPCKDTLDAFSGVSPAALLDFSTGHPRRLMALPFHHGDPFDRMLIAQALSENLTVAGNGRIAGLPCRTVRLNIFPCRLRNRRCSKWRCLPLSPRKMPARFWR
jgi:PIN domain nuclease of toxin-antitoxin system